MKKHSKSTKHLRFHKEIVRFLGGASLEQVVGGEPDPCVIREEKIPTHNAE